MASSSYASSTTTATSHLQPEQTAGTSKGPEQAKPSTVHDDVIQFLAGFSDGRPAAGANDHTAQTEAFVKALAHQLPSSCFFVRVPDHPLLRGIGAQFEEK